MSSYWKGTESLTRTFWLLYVLGSLSITFSISVSILLIGELVRFPTQSIAFLAFILLLSLNPYYLYCWVSVWRSAKNSESPIIEYLVKAVIAVHVVYFLYWVSVVPEMLNKMVELSAT